MSILSAHYSEITQEIRSACEHYGRSLNDVHLLAVSKGHSAASIEQMYTFGQHQFAESYVGEALEKQAQLVELDIAWHFIGRIQSNKTKEIAQHFSWVHSIDRLKIAKRLSEQRCSNEPPLNICIQVNINQEQSKGGVSENELLTLAREVAGLPNLRLRGLMALPQRSTDFAQQRQNFAHLRELRAELNTQGLQLDSLSMGMSNDFVAAIAEHSTHLRIGSALFGPRQT